jgi:L-rhamnose mutarotase
MKKYHKQDLRIIPYLSMKIGKMFAYLEHENLGEGLKTIYKTEVSKRWEQYMEQFFKKMRTIH